MDSGSLGFFRFGANHGNGAGLAIATCAFNTTRTDQTHNDDEWLQIHDVGSCACSRMLRQTPNLQVTFGYSFAVVRTIEL